MRESGGQAMTPARLFFCLMRNALQKLVANRDRHRAYPIAALFLACSAVLAQATAEAATYYISQTNWTLHYVDSQQTGGVGEAVKAFDGNTTTIWHSKHWPTPIDPIPHEIQINLGATYTIAGFRYLGRQDGGIRLCLPPTGS